MGVTVEFAERPRPVDRRRFIDRSDDALVGQVRTGDDSAFEEIYDRHARGILAFCVHMLGNRDEAEDALQLTFVSAYRALRNGSAQIALRPWLYTIARNRCLSELRARGGAHRSDGSVVDRSSLVGPAEQVQQREQLKEIFEDVQRLPPDQRAALVLFELGDHSHAEIAVVLGVQREKVKALIFQAREGLLRGRRARDSSCAEIREQLATSRGRPPARSMTRAHLDRCPACAAFEKDVRRHRAALALILPVLPISELKTWVLHSSLSAGRGIAAAGAGAGGGGMVLIGGGAGTGAAAGGAAGAGAVGGVVGAGTAASGVGVAAAAPSAAAVATGLTAAGADLAVVSGVAGSGSSAIVAKLATAVAIAGGVVGSGHPARPLPAPVPIVSGTQASAFSALSVQANGGPAKPAARTDAGPPTVSSAGKTTQTTPASSPSASDTTTGTSNGSSVSAGSGSSTSPGTAPASSPALASGTGAAPSAPAPATGASSSTSSAPANTVTANASTSTSSTAGSSSSTTTTTTASSSPAAGTGAASSTSTTGGTSASSSTSTTPANTTSSNTTTSPSSTPGSSTPATTGTTPTPTPPATSGTGAGSSPSAGPAVATTADASLVLSIAAGSSTLTSPGIAAGSSTLTNPGTGTGSVGSSAAAG
jgi:RNA polymerase sigma factor (sigma-70 family)